MKTITLKATKEKISTPTGERDMVLDTYHLLREVVNRTPQNGFSIEDMMQRLKLLEKLDEHKHTFTIENDIKIEDVPALFFENTVDVELEDADYNALKEWVKAMRWGIASHFIVDMVKSFQ